MNANPKSTEGPVDRPVNAKPEACGTPPGITFASLFHNGMVRFAEIQKIALDQIVRHNADFQNTWKQTYKAPSTPASVLIDLAGQGIGRLAEVQKSLMDLTVEQSALVMDISKEGVDGAAKRGKGIAEIVRQSADRLIAAEKVILDLAAEQNTLALDRIKRQFAMADTSPAAAAADSLRRGMEMVVDTQKEMLDLAAKPLKGAAPAATKAAGA